VQCGAVDNCGYFWRSMRGLLVALSCALLGACAGHAAPPPRTSLDPAEQPQTEVAPRERELAPKLLAPPPAYGNKIVMARARTTATGRF
jgi:hypothetical protein